MLRITIVEEKSKCSNMRDVRKTLDGLREIVMKGALRFLLDYFGFVFLLMLLFAYVSDGTFSDSALIWISFIMALLRFGLEISKKAMM